MKHIRVSMVLFAFALIASSCSLFGGDDDGVSASTAEQFTPEPTQNIVEQVPAQQPTVAGDGSGQAAAAAPLPTAVTIPPTEVPPEPTPDRSQPITYVVQSGDVLGLIAEEFDVDIAELRRVNGLSGNLIRVGQTLTIPALDGSASVESDEVASAPATESAAAPAPTSPPAPVSCGAGAAGHCVQPGDSLLGIALKYDVTVDSLRAANPSIDGDTIRIGDLLNLPGQTASVDTSGGSTTGTDTTGGGTVAQPTVVTDLPAASDADCAARNPEFPYFHEGACYANPIGSGTPQPTSDAGNANDECPPGRILWTDGLCYVDPRGTPTPTVGASPTSDNRGPDYGTTPCETPWFVAGPSGRCLLTIEGQDAGKGGEGTPEPSS